MSNEPKPSGNAPSPAPAGEEILTLGQLWEAKGKPLMFVASIALLAALAVVMIRGHRTRKEEAAARQLTQIASAQELEDYMNKYGGTRSAPFALLALAKAQYNSGNVDVAMNKYIEFEARYPKHELAPVARLGKMHCIEAKGDLQTALVDFTAFADQNPDSYLTPQALFGKARCLEGLGRRDDARVAYEDFIAAHPDSDWTSVAEEALKRMTIAGRSGTAAAVSAANASPDTEPTGVAVPDLKLQAAPAAQPAAAAE
jgi:tetratricopeptide (TPR) repeat protein